MATQAATIAHILDTLAMLPLTSRKMFGEYALYLEGRTVAFVCDDTLFIKPTPGAKALLPEAEMAPAYPGSKDYILGSELLDEPDFCAQVLRAVMQDTPPPKPKAPRKKKAAKLA
ncbi:TfoX/Sxy family protein [Xinfangfangia sp. CPCC 101601]|uniref:TfoX/Sxy family protein n=1 Tax=Pseudogemmobacter lacusdianii TaxID=3069608 RepID=A0ABU0VX73_9RHOB|nr:TfoX/Sxy family protein [Xinfangfangia sp. CPCC 101601]MDQ2066365.1 TfoX/Sxy family protein [Xinfangfangia sp. CPCC 101601]